MEDLSVNSNSSHLKQGKCNIIDDYYWKSKFSDIAIYLALNNLYDNGIPSVLRLFLLIKDNKINNNRTKRFILNFIWKLDNLEFYAVKYRNKIAKILRHVYGEKTLSILLNIAQKILSKKKVFCVTEKESLILEMYVKRYSIFEIEKSLKLLLFIFRKDDNVSYSQNEFPFISEYKTAKYNITKVKNVPEEVLIGLISNPNHPQHEMLWKNKEKRKETIKLIRTNVKVTSINQQVRQTKSNKELGINNEIDLNKVSDFLILYKTGYENGFNEKLMNAINILAEKNKIDDLGYENIGVIVDDSISMCGHSNDSKNTPRAIVNFMSKVLEKSTKNSVIVKTEDFYTDLGSYFIDLLKKENDNVKYDAIFILSDGYENVYDGLLDEIISVWKEKSKRKTPVFQISPIISSETNSLIRKLSDNVVSFSINKPSALKTMLELKLIEIDINRWFELQINNLKVLGEKFNR